MDIDEERLEVVYGLAKRYAEETKAKLKFERTMKGEEALRDSDFVINTALVGGHSNEEEERGIEEEHGYYRGIRLGTYFHQLKLMLSIARMMDDLCPVMLELQE